MKRKMGTATVAGILSLSLGLLLPGCHGIGARQNSAPAQSTANSASSDTEYVAAPGAAGITTTTVQLAAVPNYLQLPAQVEADPTRVVHVYPPAGGRIIEMKVRPWDQVEKGQTLAILDSGDMARAVADYRKALVDNQVKQKALERATYLYAHSAIAQKDLQQAQGDAEMSEAEVQAARAELRVFGMDPDHAGAQLRVAAPRSGVVLEIGAAQGEYSNALAAPQPLCTIADLSTVWAVGDVYEKDLTVARPGEPAQVTLDAYPGQTWNGRVSVVSDAVDPNTRTLKVRVVLANPGTRLKPAMFGSIRILRSTSRGILLPSTVVIREGNIAYLFVSKGNGRYQRRSVTLGRTVGEEIEIENGIKAGDTVVTQGGLLLRAAAGN
ncbi:MAG: efflux RND transporter periplasmic adaptor subunit [Acidobacteriota bacterium]|nr:efflux RND transporter periplasmic adaptor subunit [Acidobacteriota bacterium]